MKPTLKEKLFKNYKEKIVALGLYSTVGLAAPAYAAPASPTDVLSQVLPLIQQGVTFLGGALIVWGAVKLGLAIKDQQGGNALSDSIATIAGGAIVIAAGVFFGQLQW
jgi:hypothetical protein